MRRKLIPFLCGRASFGIFVLLTSVYCLLTYIPFTYLHFIQFPHFVWLTVFVKYHPLLYWISLGAVSLTLREDLRRPATGKLTLIFLAYHALAGIAIVVYPLLSNLENSVASFIWAMVALASLIWLAAIDYQGRRDELGWGTAGADENRRVFYACVFSGLFLPLLYFAVFYVRYQVGVKANLGGTAQVASFTWGLASHFVIFMGVFAFICLVRAVAALSRQPARVEFLLCSLAAVIVVTLVFRDLILSSISFRGLGADLFSVMAALSIVAFLNGISVRLHRPEQGDVQSGLALTLFPLTLGRITTNPGRAAWLVTLSVSAYLVAVRSALMDWNFLVQKLAILGVWSLAFAGFYAMTVHSNKQRDWTVAMLLVAVASLGGYRKLEASRLEFGGLLNDQALDVSSTLQQYEGFEVSFKVAREVLLPRRGDLSFYAFLQRNTNIPRTTKVDPVDVNLVSNLTAMKEDRPHIFIFVIDSLRRDYLSPYNDQVSFTPAIESFARESVVMENAFTHYGATGLSQPSIWAGAMLLHKQYVTPFYPMNALQKLIKADGYQPYISMDTILSVISEPSPEVVELDRGVPDKDYDFCRSLKELQTRIDERGNGKRPIFAYSQPQNIHVSVINREGASVPPGEQYPGFYAPYASRIKRMDTCFGEFIQHLKSRGLYNNSIVVLTSDHGDSLGEEGRWGHAYTLFPEIIRIPLIIHLPPAAKQKLHWDPKAIAFSTDITPSLYYLLGHRPVVANGLFGRPLFTATPEEANGYLRDSYLAASSYGAVYGILKNNGRFLYVADGVNYTDYYYDLVEDPKGTRNRVTPSIKAEHEELIRQHVEAINKFYNFDPGGS